MNLDICKEEYATLLVQGGIRLNKGERVIIKADLQIADMAKLVAKKCYENGASVVTIDYHDPEMDALHYTYANTEELMMKQWEIEKWEQQVEQLPCVINLVSSNPIQYTEDMIKNRNIVESNRLPYIGKYRTAMMDKHKWTAAGIPTQEWADQVFPDEKNNLEHLWKDILSTVMINGDCTSIEKWEKKWKDRWNHRDLLNAYQFKSLHLISGLGTDLYVELIPGGLFHAAAYRDMNYAANLPSEELYTSPMAGKAEGKLVASCPLIYNSQYIDGIELTFKDGKVVEVNASEGEQFLKNLVYMDEGSCMLGEIAIVDKDSPIRKLGHLLYHTLFDENAACHIAIGKGFSNVLPDYNTLSVEDVKRRGINSSSVHCDIMWGTEDTIIIGTTKDDKEIVIMKDGTWAI